MIEKRRRCLDDKELARIAVRVFNGERVRTVAASLGVSASYLGRMLEAARKRGAFRYVVAADAD